MSGERQSKLICFSLWGNSPKYCIGAIKNVELAQQIYPDWTCRLYIGQSVPNGIVDRLSLARGELFTGETSDNGIPVLHSRSGKVQVYCMQEPGDWRSMFWRFHAASDPNCEAMISRDCDSRLSLREKAAVDEWLASDKQWHIMRDHPWHGALMLGGMWGVKSCPAMNDWISAWDAEDRYQTDQDFLRSMVYPIASKDAMIHAQFCGIEDTAIPFPTRRSGLEFIGQVFDENEVTVAEHQTMLMRALKGIGEPVRREHLPSAIQERDKQ